MLAEMLSDWPGRFILSFMVLTVVVACIWGYAAYEDDKQFAIYANQHCHRIGMMRGGVWPGFGISAGGKSVVTISIVPDKTGYACDDGQEYWR